MDDLIFETDFFKVLLSKDDQSYIGRSTVHLKTQKDSLSVLSEEEWLDFAEVVKKYESIMKKAFDSTMFNWSCLMNNAYRQKPYTPKVHWNVRPR